MLVTVYNLPFLPWGILSFPWLLAVYSPKCSSFPPQLPNLRYRAISFFNGRNKANSFWSISLPPYNSSVSFQRSMHLSFISLPNLGAKFLVVLVQSRPQNLKTLPPDLMPHHQVSLLLSPIPSIHLYWPKLSLTFEKLKLLQTYLQLSSPLLLFLLIGHPGYISIWPILPSSSIPWILLPWFKSW